MKTVAFNQTVKLILENKSWSQIALRDHAIQCYGRMGLDTDTFNNALKWAKSH
jgi:hypothetical protein